MVRLSRLSRAMPVINTGIQSSMTDNSVCQQRIPYERLFTQRADEIQSLDDRPFSKILKGLAVQRLCAVEPVAKNAENMFTLGKKTIGVTATHSIFRHSFFEHFVAGETNEHLRAESGRLLERNTMLMLCPPMEDIHGKIADFKPEHITKNTDRFIEFLDIANDLNRTQMGQSAVVQFKPTAVFPNELMERYSVMQEGKGVSLHQATNQLADFAVLKNVPFSHDVLELSKFCMTEFMRLGKKAIEYNVPIIVDGELRSTYFMLHALSLAMMKHCNQYGQRPLVFDTFQCYMKDTPTYLGECMHVADAEKFTMGVKSVRGAYLDTERAIAKQQGRPDPTWPDLAATSKAYDQVIATCLKKLATDPKSISLFVATMNRQSVQNALKTVDELGLRIDHPNLQFAQIYGMCDHLTFALGSMGAPVYKSVPWGRVDEWIAYFGRRAAENHTALQTARNEMPYYWAELRRRLGLGYKLS